MDKVKNYVMIIEGLIILMMGLGLLFMPPKIVKETKVIEKVKYITSNAGITGGTVATISPDGFIGVSGASLTITSTTTITEREKEKDISNYSYSGLYFGIGTYLSVDPNLLNPALSYNMENWSLDLTYVMTYDLISISYNHINGQPDLLKLNYSKKFF